MTKLIALCVIVQHSKTLVTVETWVTRSELVICSMPPANVDMTNCTLLCVNPVLMGQQWIELFIQAVTPVHQPDVCNDDKMFTVSLVTVEVWKAHFHFQVYKPSIFHLSLSKRWEISTLCPFDCCDAYIPALWKPHVIIENSFKIEEC